MSGPLLKQSAIAIPADVIAKLGDTLAEMAERGSDMLAAGFAGLKAISAVTGEADHALAADQIAPFLAATLAAEIANPNPIAVPSCVVEALQPFVSDVPTTIDMPAIPPGTFADGIRIGRKNALLLEQSRKVRGRPVRGPRRAGGRR